MCAILPTVTRRFLFLLALAASLASAADVSGKWTFQVETSAGSGTPTFVLKQDGENLSGTYSGALGEAPVKGTVKGDKIEITFEVQGYAIVYSGTVESPTAMKGAVKLADQATGTWTGKKD
jgi:hypothetical protein